MLYGSVSSVYHTRRGSTRRGFGTSATLQWPCSPFATALPVVPPPVTCERLPLLSTAPQVIALCCTFMYQACITLSIAVHVAVSELQHHYRWPCSPFATALPVAPPPVTCERLPLLSTAPHVIALRCMVVYQVCTTLSNTVHVAVSELQYHCRGHARHSTQHCQWYLLQWPVRGYPCYPLHCTSLRCVVRSCIKRATHSASQYTSRFQNFSTTTGGHARHSPQHCQWYLLQ